MLKVNTIYGKIKSSIILAGVIFLILFIFLVIYKFKQEKQIVELSQQQFESDINSLFTLNSESLIKTTFDYTYWDDFVTALEENDKTWLTANIDFKSIQYGIDYACVYNSRFEIVYEVFYNALMPRNFISKEILIRLNKTRFAHFFLATTGGLVEVSAATVHPKSDSGHNKTEPSGYLFTVKLLDKKFITKMESMSSSKIVLTPSDSIVENSRFTLLTKIDLKGWDGKHVSWIFFRRVLDLNSNTTQNIIYVILVFVILALLAFNWIALKWINRPLKLVTDILENDSIKSINALKKSPAEYGRIGILFEKYLLQKEELIKSKDQAEKSDKLKSAFLGNMSHEIRTPMTHIVGFSELLYDENDETKRFEYLSIIQNSGANLLKIINDLIDLSKIEAGDLTLKYSDFNINEMFIELQKIYSFELLKREKPDVQLNYNIPDNEFVIHSDPLRIKQVLSNLLNNAIKFTARGTITVSCHRENDELIFSVSDTGTGIPEEDQKRIFERFIKFDYYGMNTDGTGIGLSIVEKIVAILQGRLWFKSVPGEGSSFFFSIPAKMVTTTSIPIPIRSSQNTSNPADKLSKKIFLVVEDDKNSFFLISEFLKPLNFKIYHVSDGKDAVDFVKMHPETHLVLMDIRLPHMDGYEATIEIRKFNSKIPIIAQTANAMLGDREKAMSAGCNDYTTKPLKSQALQDLVKMYLSK